MIRKKAKNLGDAIVLILDKLDDLEKPEMLAKVFAALVRNKITHESFVGWPPPLILVLPKI